MLNRLLILLACLGCMAIAGCSKDVSSASDPPDLKGDPPPGPPPGASAPGAGNAAGAAAQPG